MIAELFMGSVTAAVGFIYGRRGRPKHPKHEHLWEIVEKEKIDVPGAPINAQQVWGKTYNSFNDRMRMVNAITPSTDVIVHRKCKLCDEEEVQRI